MKKLIALCFLFLCMGCNADIKQIDTDDITKIYYNTMEISFKDYQQLLNIYNTIPFSTEKNKNNEKYRNTLSIHTTKQVFILSFSDNSCGKLEFNNKTYYSCHKSVEKLEKEVKKIFKKYVDSSFYDLNLVEKMDEKISASSIIRIEDSNQYIRLHFKESISNFKIHKVDFIGKEYTDVDLIYSEDKIPKGTILYIQKRMNYDYIRISFDNKYASNFSIIPTYNEDQQKLVFITKKNPL